MEGFGPYRPGMSMDDPEGIVAEALPGEAQPRPKLRLVHTKVSPRESLRLRVIRLDVERGAVLAPEAGERWGLTFHRGDIP